MTFQTIGYVAILAAVLLLIMSDLREDMGKDTFTIIDEEFTITELNYTFNGTLSKTSDVLESGSTVVSSNFTTLVVDTDYNIYSDGTIEVFNATGNIDDPTDWPINVTFDYQVDSNSQIALDNSSSGIVNIFKQFPLFGTIIGFLLIIGIVFVLLRGRTSGGNNLI